MGQISILVGIIIVIIDAIMGEGIGWATFGNVILIGTFLDMFEAMNIIPYATNLFSGLIMLLIGIALSALATVIYLKPALGSGPRDGLMLAINKRTSKSVGQVRVVIELSALFAGWLLGGSVGIGTVISGIGLSYAIQISFKMANINSKELHHRSVFEDFR